MHLCVLKHVAFEGPGAIAEWAAERGHVLAELAAPNGELPDPVTCDFLVVLGGPMGAGDVDAHPWLSEEKAYLRSVAGGSEGPAVLGVCLGAQLVAEALGGVVRRNTEPEIGWFPVRLTASGRSSTPLERWPDRFVAGHWHGDTFDLASAIKPAARSDATSNQAFVAREGRVVGLQFHLEWTHDSLLRLVEACGAELVPGRFVQSAEELLGHDEHLAASRVLLFDLLDAMAARIRR